MMNDRFMFLGNFICLSKFEKPYFDKFGRPLMKNIFLLLSFLFCVTNTSVLSQPTSAAANPEIFINVSVMDARGRAVTGLDKTAFTVNEDKETAEISSFISDEPAEVLFLFDKSKRMSDLYRKADPGKQSLVSHFLSRFMQSGHPANSYSLFAFRKTQEQILATTGNQNNVLAALDALDALKMEGSTSYLDACYFGIEKLRQSTGKKRALILFTQGGSEQSAYTFKQVNALLRENNILLYVIAVFEPTSLAESGFGGPANMSENYKNQVTKQDEFNKLVTVTGGRVFFPMSASEMAEIFSRLGSELQNQYTIGIKLANTSGAGKSRRIKIKIKPPAGTSNLKIRYREEFVID